MFLAPSKIRSHEVIFRHPLRFTSVIIPAKRMTLLWFQQFCCPAGPTETTRTHTYTVPWFSWTVMWFPLPISQCQMERESNRECKREHVWQWLEYLLGHCSWLCISPHFWMGIFSSHIQRYNRRWLGINNESSEGSLKPDQFCCLSHWILAREKLCPGSGLCSFIDIGECFAFGERLDEKCLEHQSLFVRKSIWILKLKKVGREGFELWFNFKCVYNNTKLIPYRLLANIIFFTYTKFIICLILLYVL